MNEYAVLRSQSWISMKFVIGSKSDTFVLYYAYNSDTTVFRWCSGSSKKFYSIICHKNPPTHSKHTHLNEVIKNGRCDTCSVLLLLIIFRHVKLVKAKNVLKTLRKIEKICFRDEFCNYIMGHSRNNIYPSIEETENIPLPLSGHPTTEVRPSLFLDISPPLRHLKLNLFLI